VTKPEEEAKLRRAAIRNAVERLDRNLTVIRGAVDHLDDGWIDVLARRGRHVASGDGFKARTLADGAPSVSHHTSVEAAALRGLPDAVDDDELVGDRDDWSRHRAADPAGRALAELWQLLDRMADLAAGVDRCAGFLAHIHLVKAGREDSTQGSCLRCARTVAGSESDRLKGGYCPACYTAWHRLGKPERGVFERSLAAESA